MVRVLCYGHKSYKFESYTRLKKKDMNSLLIYIDGMARFASKAKQKWCGRFAVARNIIKGYVVEGSTFLLQIENSGFNTSVSLVALL